jgi:hypothetical protein
MEKHIKTVYINPPPRNKKCECCGRHIKDLKPFGGKGDPLVGDFKGALLVKTFREDVPNQVGASWECRDCIVLSDADYRKKTR